MSSSDVSVHVRRIYSEYLEMPGLRLTCAQAQRLWGLDPETCTAALRALIEAGFLRLTAGDQYVRVTEGRVTTPVLRMAKAALNGPSASRSKQAK